MSVLVGKDTKVLVQGFTGKNGTLHSEQSIAYGTNIVGGVTPGKGGTTHLDRPVFDTMDEAVTATGANASVIFVPAPFVLDSIVEAINSGVKLIVVITEGVPTLDMLKAKRYLENVNADLQANGEEIIRMVGPNCPGVISPGKCKIGIMPGHIHQEGKVGIISRSGTLTYEAVAQTTKLGFGQSTCIGIGGDPIIGTPTKEAVELLMNDPETEGIIMIGEIGGGMEAEAARWIKENGTKPVVGFIAGQTAPAGRRMGHAGAIVGGADDTAAAKMKIMRECGITVVESPAEIGAAMAALLKK